MPRHFSIPTEPLARYRLLSLLFAASIALFNVGAFVFDPHLGAAVRAGATLATILLIGWWTFGYRHGGFPVVGWIPELILVALITSLSPLPFHGMAFFLIGVQIRALYASRRELGFVIVGFAAARVLSGMLIPDVSSRLPLLGTLALQTFGLAAVAITLHLFVDATQRHAASERALARSDERYQLVARTVREVVYDWNVITGAVEWTASMQTVFGFAPGAVGQAFAWWLDRVHPDDREALDRTLATVLANAEASVETLHYRVRCADDRYVFVSGSMIVQRTPEGAAERVIGSIRDVTGERQLEERLRQTQKMEAVGQLAGGVAHDFNNLLTVIGGHVFMLEHGLGSTPLTDKHLGGISRAADRAAVLTKQLLAFSRKQLLTPSVLNVNAIVDDVVMMMRPAIGEHIQVVTSLDPLLAPVFADAGQLGQVLVNLALNARDAMPNGGTLVIETANTSRDGRMETAADAALPAGDYVRLTIRDTGIGMDAATLARAFEPFFTTKATGQGSGLGLATVYGIVKQSYGDIQATSTPGVGSTFTVLLPVARRPADATPVERRAPSAPPPRADRQRTVLLVEDDDGVRDFAREVLARAGYEVRTARNGLEGLRVARSLETAADMVVTDVVMPEMGGRQMAEQLRRRWPTVPVLYITGYTEDSSGMLDQIRGSDARLLEKPFTAATFTAIVDEMSDPAARASGVLTA